MGEASEDSKTTKGGVGGALEEVVDSVPTISPVASVAIEQETPEQETLEQEAKKDTEQNATHQQDIMMKRSKPKVVFYFVRHAQAECNWPSTSDPSILRKQADMRNAPLTEFGRDQCKTLKNTLISQHNFTHVLCSPLARSLETALLAGEPLYEKGVKVIAWPILREFGDCPANTGDTLANLTKAMKGKPVNLQLLREGWEVPIYSRYDSRENKDKLKRNFAAHIKQTLKMFEWMLFEGGTWGGITYEKYDGEDDIEVLVVSHGGLLHQLFGHKFRNTQVEREPAVVE